MNAPLCLTCQHGMIQDRQSGTPIVQCTRYAIGVQV